MITDINGCSEIFDDPDLAPNGQDIVNGAPLLEDIVLSKRPAFFKLELSYCGYDPDCPDHASEHAEYIKAYSRAS